MTDSGTYRVQCDNCGTDEEFDSLSEAVERVEFHNYDSGCLYPVDTSIELPDTEVNTDG